MLSAETLILQLNEFKKWNNPYSVEYDYQNLIKNKYENLQLLVKKIFSIVSHSTFCERIFLALG